MTPPVYFEQIERGRQLRSARRTVTEADIVNFAGVSGDFQALHTDAVFVREQTPFRERIAHGLLVLSIASGLRSELDNWSILAFLETQRAFVGPTYAGDTIHAEMEVQETRASSSRPGCGVVRVGILVRNDSDDVLQTGHDVLLVGGPSR